MLDEGNCGQRLARGGPFAGRSAAAWRTMHRVKRFHLSNLGKGVWLRSNLVLTDAFPRRIRG